MEFRLAVPDSYKAELLLSRYVQLVVSVILAVAFYCILSRTTFARSAYLLFLWPFANLVLAALFKTANWEYLFDGNGVTIVLAGRRFVVLRAVVRTKSPISSVAQQNRVGLPCLEIIQSNGDQFSCVLENADITAAVSRIKAALNCG